MNNTVKNANLGDQQPSGKSTRTSLRKRLAAGALAAVSVLALTGCGLGSQSTGSAGGSTVYFSVLYPKTGQYATYGKQFEDGLNLAVKQVNAEGGLSGKKLALKYYDTQSDPKQDASVAPKIAADQSTIAVLGDYSSAASMAASPTFQQAKLVHYGFNNSLPTFTSTGDYVWTPQISDDQYQVVQADFIAKHVKTVSVLYLNNDWGLASNSAFQKEAKKVGLKVLYTGSYLASSTDLTPELIPATQAKPDAVYDIGYGPDGALALNQLRNKLNYKGIYFGGQETPEFLSDSGANADGTAITGSFEPTGARTAAQKTFVKDFEAAYKYAPGNFEVTAYQAVIDLAYAAKQTSPTRAGIEKALKTVKDFPLIQGDGGTFNFDVATRRAPSIKPIMIVAEGGKWQVYNGQKLNGQV